MKRRLKISIFLFVLFAILSGGVTQRFPVSVEAAVKKQTGFVMKNGIWYFYDKKGKKVTEWYQSPSGDKYYFGKDGAAKAGIFTIRGKQYAFSSKGKMYRNYFYKNKGVTFFFQGDGTMAKGRLKVKNSWYSFNRNTGRMVIDRWYKETDGSYYYADPDGKLVAGFYKPDSYYRYFRKSDGRLLTGWQTINGYKYYFKKTNGIRYDNIILKSSAGKSYYFEKDGKLATGKWITKNGADYYASSNGVLATGWLSVNGDKYYMNPSTCERQTGWISVNGKKYYLDTATGVLATNKWVDDKNYVGDNGALIPGYQKGTLFRWPLSSCYSYISSYFGNRNSPGGMQHLKNGRNLET